MSSPYWGEDLSSVLPERLAPKRDPITERLRPKLPRMMDSAIGGFVLIENRKRSDPREDKLNQNGKPVVKPAPKVPKAMTIQPPRLPQTLSGDAPDFSRGGFTYRVEADRLSSPEATLQNLTLQETVVSRSDFSQSDWTGAQITDVRFVGCDLSGVDFGGASLTRVELLDCRLTGAQFCEAELKHVLIADSRLDYGNLRAAKAASVLFRETDLRESDFQGIELKDSSFSKCQLNGVDFAHARFSRVDLQNSDLTVLKSSFGLKGAIVSADQIIDLAPLLARDAGIVVV